MKYEKILQDYLDNNKSEFDVVGIDEDREPLLSLNTVNRLLKKQRNILEVKKLPIVCIDRFGDILKENDIVDVQRAGEFKIFKKDDGELYFNPYGKDEKVHLYFSNEIIKVI